MEAREAKPERQPEASADHLATEDSGENPSPTEALKEAAEEKQVHASKDEELVEVSEEVREEGTIHAEVIDDTFDDELAKQPVEERRKRTLLGFLFRMAAPTFATLILLLFLCDVLNQRLGLDIPLGLGVVGISTTDYAKEAEDNRSKDAAATISKSNDMAALTAELERTKKELASARAAASVKAGTVITIRDLGLDMLWVKPGTFEMGSTSFGTPHSVTLTDGYWLGKHEATQAQWQKVMGNNPSHFKGVDRPVEKVSWTDANAFCEKLTELERKAGRLPAGMSYQLPTEAQWEYACRAGTKTTYGFGDTLSSGQANIRGGPGESKDVGKYPTNAWGFHDMHGNVWEWCADWFGNYTRGTVTDPLGPAVGSVRVRRGGSWSDMANGARSADRLGYPPAISNNIQGFRLSLRPASQ
jgi:formylglycine-generating enzyme